MSKRARVSRAPKSKSSRGLRPRSVDSSESKAAVDPKLAQRDSEPEASARATDSEPEASARATDSEPEPSARATDSEPDVVAPVVAPETKKAEREHAPASTPSVKQRKSDPPPSARRSVDDADALTSSGVAEDFFREDDSSLSPHGLGDDEVDEEPAAHLSLTPEQLDRRARLRRIVAGVVAVAALLVVGGVVKLAVTDKASVAVAPDPTKTIEPTAESGPSVNAAGAPTAAKTDAPVDVAAALVAPAADEASAVAEAKAAEETKAAADAKAAEEAKAAEAKAAEHAEAADAGGGAALDKAAIAALRKTTESLLNRGKRKEAIASARELIAADPGEAMGYLFLGSALQDSGKWKEGIEAYSECVRHATRGPVHECRAMGGRK